MPIGDFPDILSQAMLVGVMLVGDWAYPLAALLGSLAHAAQAPLSAPVLSLELLGRPNL